MTADLEPWPLLAALDELLAREGWQTSLVELTELECLISDETRVTTPEGFARLWAILPCEDHVEPPFLRSRDAAAMLEEALGIQPYPLDTPGLPEMCPIAFRFWQWWWLSDGPGGRSSDPIDPRFEAAYRTRAALEAGWRLGIWPVKAT